MTTPGGEWVAVPIEGAPDRWDFVPTEQPPSPDGRPGRWHVVGGSGTEVGKWEWFPAAAAPPPPPPPPPPVLMPWESATPSAPTPAFGEQETTPISREPSPWQPAPAPQSGAQQPPVFGAPAPAGWHAAPPMGAVPPKRSRKVPLIIAAVVVVLA